MSSSCCANDSLLQGRAYSPWSAHTRIRSPVSLARRGAFPISGEEAAGGLGRVLAVVLDRCELLAAVGLEERAHPLADSAEDLCFERQDGIRGLDDDAADRRSAGSGGCSGFAPGGRARSKGRRS